MAKRVEELQRVHARALQTFTQQLPAQVRRGVCLCACAWECRAEEQPAQAGCGGRSACMLAPEVVPSPGKSSNQCRRAQVLVPEVVSGRQGRATANVGKVQRRECLRPCA